jgi:hypothetical protein
MSPPPLQVMKFLRNRYQIEEQKEKCNIDKQQREGNEKYDIMGKL